MYQHEHGKFQFGFASLIQLWTLHFGLEMLMIKLQSDLRIQVNCNDHGDRSQPWSSTRKIGFICPKVSEFAETKTQLIHFQRKTWWTEFMAFWRDLTSSEGSNGYTVIHRKIPKVSMVVWAMRTRPIKWMIGYLYMTSLFAGNAQLCGRRRDAPLKRLPSLWYAMSKSM